MSRVRETEKTGTLFLKRRQLTRKNNNITTCNRNLSLQLLVLTVKGQNGGNESEIRECKQNNFPKCSGASKAMGKGDIKESNASRTLMLILVICRLVRQRFQGLLCSHLQSMGGRKKGSLVLSSLWPKRTSGRCSE